MGKQSAFMKEDYLKSRVGRLRWDIIDAPMEVCIERARYLTRSMKENWSRDPLERMSLAFEHILNNITPIIRDGELIVGCRTSKLKGAPLFPENKSRWIGGDLDGLSIRAVQAALIGPAEIEELRSEILPFWQGKSVEDVMEARMPPDILEDMDKYVFTMMLEITYGVGHFTIDHGKVLDKGLIGIINEAREKLEQLDAGESGGRKQLFYEAVIRSCSAVISFARRYSELALSMAEKERDRTRAAELRRIGRVCARVPAHPAESFHEAVQSLYFVHLTSQIESGGNSISLGRIDQILYPCYRRDMEAGLITPAEARELLSLLYIKTNEIWNLLEEAFIPGGEGTQGKTTQNTIVGGIDAAGNDATNELSYIGLDAFSDVRTVQPNFGVRISSKSPEDFLSRAVDYARDGVLLHFFNDEAIVKTLVHSGHTLEDARNYGIVGCLEPNAQGKTFGSTFAVQFNGLKCVEFALTDGIDNIFGYPSGLETGDPTRFDCFEDLWNAYDRQVSHFANQVARGMFVLDEAIADNVPSPFASAVVEGCLEKGLDLTRGGAIYNSTGIQLMGFANTVDSLYAIKKVVFDDKILSMEQLVDMLSDDWYDAEKWRTYMLNRVPKFGNDDDEVDAMARRVVEHYCTTIASHKNFRGGHFWPGIFSVGFHISFGAFTGATPDGRHAGDVLGNGVTPTTGNAVSGPTAVMNSVVKLPLWMIYNGANLNMRFQGKKVKTAHMVSLIRTYMAGGGVQVQFNMVDSETLKKAKLNPEQYRDLFVRVSGYSAEFVDLSEIAQDEIISRTEYE